MNGSAQDSPVLNLSRCIGELGEHHRELLAVLRRIRVDLALPPPPSNGQNPPSHPDLVAQDPGAVAVLDRSGGTGPREMKRHYDYFAELDAELAQLRGADGIPRTGAGDLTAS